MALGSYLISMATVEELKKIVEDARLADGEKLKQQLDLLSSLPGEYNQQVLDKLLELARHDSKAIPVFIEQFLKTMSQLIK
jgi:uncharacterized protein YbaP (TraB family)